MLRFFKLLSLHGEFKDWLEKLPKNSFKQYQGAAISAGFKDELKQSHKLRSLFGLAANEVDTLVDDAETTREFYKYLLSDRAHVKSIRASLTKLSSVLQKDEIPTWFANSGRKNLEQTGLATDVTPPTGIPGDKTDAESDPVRKKLRDSGAQELDKIMEMLNRINGQDAYTIEIAGVAPLAHSDHLILTDDIAVRMKSVSVSQIGHDSGITEEEWFQLVYLNAMALSSATKASEIKRTDWDIAILRANMVKYGLASMGNDGKANGVRHNEIRTAAAPVIDYEELIKELDPHMKHLDDLHTMALLAPVLANHMFLKTGHHYLNDSYDKMYEKLISSCQIADISNVIPYNMLFHKAIHWCGPLNARHLWLNLEEIGSLPAAMVLRKNSPPAGTALLCTTRAVIDHITKVEAFSDISNIYKEEIGVLRYVDDLVKADPTVYSNQYHLFNHASCGKDDDVFKRASVAAKTLACVCQAYLDTICKNTRLSQAKALKNAADEQAFLKRQLVNYFKNVIDKMGDTASLKEILQLEKEEIAKPRSSSPVRANRPRSDVGSSDESE